MEILLQLEGMSLAKKGKWGWITFERSEALNAVDTAATIRLERLILALGEDPDIRIVVLRGTGRAFCTGIDLKELAAGGIDMDYHRRWEHTLRRIELMEKIFIVGMHGYCLGGGLQLALACDIRVSTDDCRIGLPAVRESLIPGLSTWRLPRYIGWGRAKKMILGGENIDGNQARRIGLVDHLVAGEAFFEQLDGVGARYMQACSVGTRMSKLLVNRAADYDFEAFLADYEALQQRAQYSLDALSAGRAYREGNNPEWQ
ncbi:MAG TPA: enoyl-CoA hydratase/isomerase family protein [Desulfobacterales bacterium]